MTCWSPRPARCAGVVSPAELGPHYIIPSVFHPDVASAVAAAVRDAAGAGRPGPSAPSPRPIGENECVAEILAGRLLVATPLLGDPNFRRSVVLVVEDEPGEGTLGVVLNRPTETPVEQVLESWTDLVTQPSVVFRGGPVSPNSALGLAIVPGEDEPVGWRALDGMTLRSRIGLVNLDAPPQLLEGGIASLRVFAGYAGWGPGQVQARDRGRGLVRPPGRARRRLRGRAGAALADGAAPGRGHPCPGRDVSG